MVDNTAVAASLRTVIVDTARLTGLHIICKVESATAPWFIIRLTVSGVVVPLGRMTIDPSPRMVAVTLRRLFMGAAQGMVEEHSLDRLTTGPGRVHWRMAADLSAIAFALDTLARRYDVCPLPVLVQSPMVMISLRIGSTLTPRRYSEPSGAGR